FEYKVGATVVTTATVLSANVAGHTIVATFTPTDTDNYVSGGTVQNTLVVNKATPTLTWTPNPLTAITYGTDLTGKLTASSGTVGGTFEYKVGATVVTAATVLNANVAGHTIVATFTPTDGDNYVSGGTVQNTLVVNKATPPLTWTPSPLTAITYGTDLTGKLTASSGTVGGTFEYKIGATVVTAATVLNANLARSTIVATFTPTDGYNNVSGGTVQNTLIVNKATTSVGSITASA